jgi:hypothetical protein
MYFLVLAADFDRTIAYDGVVAAETCHTLRHLKETGDGRYLSRDENSRTSNASFPRWQCSTVSSRKTTLLSMTPQPGMND